MISISTILFALCGQSGADATFETPTQSPEQIEWIEVWTYVAAFDRTVHQRIDGPFDQIRI